MSVVSVSKKQNKNQNPCTLDKKGMSILFDHTALSTGSNKNLSFLISW